MRKIVFVALSLFAFSYQNAFSVLTDPDPALTYLGDVNGDHYFQADDMPAVQTYLNGNVAVYDTMQPQPPDQYWNTSDTNGDQFLQADDVPDMQTYLNGNIVQKTWNSWTITRGTLPATADVDAATAFQVGVQAEDGIPGPQGRPGMNVEIAIDPASTVQNVTLGGRDCAPFDGSCKVSTGITDWIGNPTEALTEIGATGFSFTAHESGVLKLRAKIYEQFQWNIPETIVIFSVTVEAPINQPPIITNAPPTGPAIEDTLFSYTFTATDPESDPITFQLSSGNTCAGATINPVTGVFTFTPLGPVPPASCVVGVQACNGIGDEWLEIGTGSASGGGISNNSGPSYNGSLAIDSSGNPVVAWQDSSGGNYDIYIKRWDGTAWVEIGTGSASGGGISNNSGGSFSPSLALDSNDNPIVAWDDYTRGYYEIYVKRWNGSAWVEIGAGSASGGGLSNDNAESKYASIAIDSSDNPIIAWENNNYINSEIYAKRWNGSAWIDIGTGSSSGGGISNTPSNSFRPSIDIDSNQNPVIAWADNSGGDGEIYIKRWTGSEWADIGIGSSSGGGISNNSGHSYQPSMELDSSDNPIVAWHDYTSGNSEIYIKSWNGTNRPVLPPLV